MHLIDEKDHADGRRSSWKDDDESFEKHTHFFIYSYQKLVFVIVAVAYSPMIVSWMKLFPFESIVDHALEILMCWFTHCETVYSWFQQVAHRVLTEEEAKRSLESRLAQHSSSIAKERAPCNWECSRQFWAGSALIREGHNDWIAQEHLSFSVATRIPSWWWMVACFEKRDHQEKTMPNSHSIRRKWNLSLLKWQRLMISFSLKISLY